jgi:hypothetical protein
LTFLFYPINPDFQKKYPIGKKNSKHQAPNSKQIQKTKSKVVLRLSGSAVKKSMEAWRHGGGEAGEFMFRFAFCIFHFSFHFVWNML